MWAHAGYCGYMAVDYIVHGGWLTIENGSSVRIKTQIESDKISEASEEAFPY